MKIEVVIALGPRQVATAQISSNDDINVQQAQTMALAQLGLVEDGHTVWAYAVWGTRVELTTPLKDGDRLELLRPLTVDPKEARRLRFNQQGSRAAGLFAKRRQGAKAGY
jgi:putative ubiquitin-RnfH superfamily antitoxin RatB of RatAB toxin-antitoxin module